MLEHGLMETGMQVEARDEFFIDMVREINELLLSFDEILFHLEACTKDTFVGKDEALDRFLPPEKGGGIELFEELLHSELVVVDGYVLRASHCDIQWAQKGSSLVIKSVRLLGFKEPPRENKVR